MEGAQHAHRLHLAAGLAPPRGFPRHRHPGLGDGHRRMALHRGRDRDDRARRRLAGAARRPTTHAGMASPSSACGASSRRSCSTARRSSGCPSRPRSWPRACHARPRDPRGTIERVVHEPLVVSTEERVRPPRRSLPRSRCPAGDPGHVRAVGQPEVGALADTGRLGLIATRQLVRIGVDLADPPLERHLRGRALLLRRPRSPRRTALSSRKPQRYASSAHYLSPAPRGPRPRPAGRCRRWRPSRRSRRRRRR